MFGKNWTTAASATALAGVAAFFAVTAGGTSQGIEVPAGFRVETFARGLSQPTAMAYGPDGRMQNAGFLDYRMPVASDVPMIDTVIVEVPNPRHPYGVRGVGETPIVPPMAAVANAIAAATGIRFTELPMSPPKVLKAIDEAKANGSGNGTGG